MGDVKHFLKSEMPAAMKEIEGSTMVFSLARDDETRERQPGTTFSADGLNEIAEAARVWLWTRCFRHLTKDPERPATHRKVTMTVTVEVDDEPESSVPLALEIVDGMLRIHAAEGNGS